MLASVVWLADWWWVEVDVVCSLLPSEASVGYLAAVRHVLAVFELDMRVPTEVSVGGGAWASSLASIGCCMFGRGRHVGRGLSALGRCGTS